MRPVWERTRRHRRLRLARGRPDARLRPRAHVRAGDAVQHRRSTGPTSTSRSRPPSPVSARSRTASRKGVSINVTLIFSLERYAAVAEAYLRGLERLVAGGGDPGQGALGRELLRLARRHRGRQAPRGARPHRPAGQARRSRTRSSPTSTTSTSSATTAGRILAGKGARPQRCLWASTSTKNPAYRDVIYVEELIGPDTVNTMPLETVRGVPGSRRGRSRQPDGGIDEAKAAARRSRRGRRRLRRRRRDARGRGRAEVRRLVRRAAGRHPRQAWARWRPHDARTREPAARGSAAAAAAGAVRRSSIFGASGDLTQAQADPRALRARLPQAAAGGVRDRRRRALAEQTSAQFAAAMKKAVKQFARDPFRQDVWDRLAAGMRYVGTEFDDEEGEDRVGRDARGGRRRARARAATASTTSPCRRRRSRRR